ncbi:type VII secretion protein EccB [Streptomyces sp. NPDC048383]|uniref:type VII secretion protein EccB n=1 Tax=Streptomyces sp. NPDC048383 TaxID=3155386 RepID=UPI0034296890
MASRRDELNAYTFAKRRTVAAFLQPSATGSEEGAPRPLRAILPTLIVGVLVLVGSGAWGMFRPQAPKGWNEPGARVIVGSRSTTRYVILSTEEAGSHRSRLHPVLNLASARLLLDPRKFKVVHVKDEVLDAGRPPRGPIIGIPYAPDRLPEPKDAGKPKRWAVCQRPGGNGLGVQSAVFVLADREAGPLDGTLRTTDRQVLYVRSTGAGRQRYLVDATGTKYAFPDGGPAAGTLTTALVGADATPQPVTEQWLATLDPGDDLAFPRLPGSPGAHAGVRGLAAADNRVGTVLSAQTGAGTQYYVVLPGRVAPVTEFMARLLIAAPTADALDLHGRAREVDLQSLGQDVPPFGADVKWPRRRGVRINGVGAAGGEPAGTRRDTVCNVLRAVDAAGVPTLSTWAGSGFPVDITASGAGSYVTPGSGLLYTQVQGRQTAAGGSLFLVTDTGLRYAVPADGSGSDGGGGGGRGRPGVGEAQTRLGYADVVPPPVPIAWSEFLSKGPRLDTESARRTQGS